MGATITVPMGSMDGGSYHSTCGSDWMGAPITECLWVKLDQGLLSQYLWVRLDQGPLSLSTCRSDWMGAPIIQCLWVRDSLSQYLWVAWMGAPITVPVG
jgi:hypothetical protein